MLAPQKITSTNAKTPRVFLVIMLNDDYTPMEFVISVLTKVFNMPLELATQVMLQVHQQGQASCGVFTKDVAEMKASAVTQMARQHGYPLKTLIEPV